MKIDDELLGSLYTSLQNSKSPNNDLGMTQKYDRKLYDSESAKKKFKDENFGDKQTYKDPISGKVLHKSSKAAASKYHQKNDKGEVVSTKWADHAAETDHIKTLQETHTAAKHNPFLSDADFKEIANCDENFRILPKSLNTSKGSKSDSEYVKTSGKGLSTASKRVLKRGQMKSDAVLHVKFGARTVKNAGSVFVSQAKDSLVASAIPLTVSAVSQLINVAKGNIELKDAAKNVMESGVGIAAVGGSTAVLEQIAKNIPALNGLTGGTIAKIIMVGEIVGKSAVRYINGEISEKEFFEEIGTKGKIMAFGMIGGQIGKEMGIWLGSILGTIALPGVGTGVGAIAGEVIGEIIGTIITTIACSVIMSFYNVKKHIDDYKLKEKHIRKLEREALREMANQRNNFKSIVEREFKIWDETVQSGFDMVLRSACEETYNLEGITEGLDKVLSVFGKEVAFKTLEEYEDQLDMPLKLSFTL